MMLYAAVDTNLTQRWFAWLGRRWLESNGFAPEIRWTKLLRALVSALSAAALRHILLGWEVAGRWLGSASGSSRPPQCWQR